MSLIKTQIIQFRAPTYFKNDQDKRVITSIQSAWVTRPPRELAMSNLGAFRAHLGPAVRALRKFCIFDATMSQYGG